MPRLLSSAVHQHSLSSVCPAHSTFNHFRSIIFQHFAPHSRSHLWCTQDNAESVLNLLPFFYYLQNDQSKTFFFVQCTQHKVFKKGNIFMLRFYADALQEHQTDFLCCNCAVKFLLAGELKSLHPNTCVAFIFLSHRHAISVRERIFENHKKGKCH